MAQPQDWKTEAEEADEEEELDDSHYKSAKDAVLFMIDVSDSMLATPAPSERKGQEIDSALSASLKCAYELMTSRITSNPNDMMGVLFHGVDTTNLDMVEPDPASQEIRICPQDYLLVDLCIPSASDVKRLKDFAEDEATLRKVVPASEGKSLANTLFYAGGIFRSRAANFASRRLFIITDNDDPHHGNDRLKTLSTQRAKDLFDLEVIIELFPVVQAGLSFDKTKFYNDILYSDTPSDAEAPAPLSNHPAGNIHKGTDNLLASLLSSIKMRIVPKRALFANLAFEVGPGLVISVKGYIIFKRQEPKRTSFVWLGGHDAQIAKGQSMKVSDETGHVIAKPEIRKAYKFGGEQVSFSTDEMAAIRDFGAPVIRIIGFKGISSASLPIWANIRDATFLCPSEEDYVGSTRVFSALHGKMSRDNKVALAWFVARKNSVPQMAAIWPDTERFNEEGGHTLPSGLWLIPLPFADDIRDNPDTMMIEAPDALVDRMRQVIQQLQLPKGQYVPTKYPNPALQWHYRVLQAMALEEEAPIEPEDKTVPKYRQISKRAGQYVEDWGTELSEQHRLWEAENRRMIPLPKRPAADANGDHGGNVKKRARPTVDDEIDDEKMRQLVSKNNVTKLTVAELKKWLIDKGFKATGKKVDLVQEVETWFESK